MVVKDGKTLVPNRQRKKAYETHVALAGTEDPAEHARLTAVLRGLDQQRKQVEGPGRAGSDPPLQAVSGIAIFLP